jgi:hypothetical protein
MKIGQSFNQLTFKEYQFYIENHKKYTDFNTLGLYRSLLENEKLTLAEKLELREFAHSFFQKTFDFLQLKDPKTYMLVSTLGEELTKADIRQMYENIWDFQQRTIKEKQFNHRNFGVYGKHDCGYETCPLNGLMVQQGSYFCESTMRFNEDKNATVGKHNSESRKKDRKNERVIIRKELEDDVE